MCTGCRRCRHTDARLAVPVAVLRARLGHLRGRPGLFKGFKVLGQLQVHVAARLGVHEAKAISKFYTWWDLSPRFFVLGVCGGRAEFAPAGSPARP